MVAGGNQLKDGSPAAKAATKSREGSPSAKLDANDLAQFSEKDFLEAQQKEPPSFRNSKQEPISLELYRKKRLQEVKTEVQFLDAQKSDTPFLDADDVPWSLELFKQLKPKAKTGRPKGRPKKNPASPKAKASSPRAKASSPTSKASSSALPKATPKKSPGKASPKKSPGKTSAGKAAPKKSPGRPKKSLSTEELPPPPAAVDTEKVEEEEKEEKKEEVSKQPAADTEKVEEEKKEDVNKKQEEVVVTQVEEKKVEEKPPVEETTAEKVEEEKPPVEKVEEQVEQKEKVTEPVVVEEKVTDEKKVEKVVIEETTAKTKVQPVTNTVEEKKVVAETPVVEDKKPEEEKEKVVGVSSTAAPVVPSDTKATEVPTKTDAVVEEPAKKAEPLPTAKSSTDTVAQAAAQASPTSEESKPVEAPKPKPMEIIKDYIDVPKHTIGKIIGAQGATIKWMQSYTNTKIECEKCYTRETKATRWVTITGDRESIELAKKIINCCINSVDEHGKDIPGGWDLNKFKQALRPVHKVKQDASSKEASPSASTSVGDIYVKPTLEEQRQRDLDTNAAAARCRDTMVVL